MKKSVWLACAVLAVVFVGQITAWAGEDIMPMHPGAAGRNGQSQLHVNQVRLRLPAAGSAAINTELERAAPTAVQYDEYITFGQPNRMETPSMGIPGLIGPETLAEDYRFHALSSGDIAPVAPASTATQWSSFELPGVFTPVPIEPESGSAREPLVVEMPPPISGVSLPLPPNGGRMYEDVPVFYSSLPPADVWSYPGVR
jgi:hypothetical protein